jgi:hypothetical protein
MKLICSIIQPTEIEEIQQFESVLLNAKIPDEMERNLFSWSAPWRNESLEHYFKLGWSFLVRSSEDNTIVGYFLAQPLLFLDGQTQSLWIEHISCKSQLVEKELCDLAHRLCKEKHFQKIYFPKSKISIDSISHLKFESWSADRFEVKTTRM